MKHGVDLSTLVAGCENDALDESAQCVGRLLSLLRMSQSFRKPRNLSAVNLRNIRMDVRYVSGRRSKPSADGIFPRLQFKQLIDERARPLAFRSKRHQPFDRLQNLVQLSPICDVCGATLAIEAIGFLDAGANCFGSDLRTH
ncbi:hypothetical protein AB3M93_21090 [Novosphingobium panipatense]|uniref:hypothetical protein n=1 Tax=Novosphingobium TaxID=165696 RepID=UPI001E295DAC|nr:hypothetical protein [Novosphingobium sp. HII-3]